MTTPTMTQADPALLSKICDRAFAQMVTMIHLANTRKEKQPGDPKVGGHPAACASSLHILGALHLAVREVHDYVCCKPHAAPMDHSFHHLMRLFRHHEDDSWLTDTEGKELMRCLRMFPEDGGEVFQSYHARSDPDSFHFLPSGSVGIPPVVSVYLALAHRYAGDHKLEVPPHAHFWSLIGDSEFREGSILECMPDAAERQLGNVTWIVDYNRQNLDGTRIPNDRGLHSRDCDRIEATALANGWKVIQVRHGSWRKELFEREGGDSLRELFETGLSDFEYQILLFSRELADVRDHCKRHVPASAKVVDSLDDDELWRAFTDLGGHDMAEMIDALQASREEPDEPYLIIPHTIKGWGLDCFADPSNHSSLPSAGEVRALQERSGLDPEDPFALFDAETPEGAYLAERSWAFRSGIEGHLGMRRGNREVARNHMVEYGGLPDSLGIDLTLFPRVHTQWAWGQLAAKLVRIGTSDVEDFHLAGVKKEKELTDDERRWKGVADYVLTMSPDVGTSTNIAPSMDQRIYGPKSDGDEDDLGTDAKHPDLHQSEAGFTGHIRFEIAEANCMSAVAAFGKMGHYTGIPFFPIMTVYDFFIKRALDQLYYNLYWGAEFVIVGTPSGVTLSPEGAQHSWKSDIQIPNLITWEPLFAVEVDWILSDALKRHMEDTNDGRRGVLIRAVTRAVQQAPLLDFARRQARNKIEVAPGTLLKPAGAGDEWGDAVDESTIPALDDAALLARVREECLLGGYYLVDWRGYAGYEPGDNVVHLFAMGSLTTEAYEASQALVELGIYANVIVVTSPELMFGILGEQDGYSHLRDNLGVTGDLYAVEGAGESEAGLLSVAGRRVPIVAVCDGEAGLLDNIGSIVGVKQQTQAVRKFSKCGRPDQVFEMHALDKDSLIETCGRVLAETALEDLRVSPALLERMAGRAPAKRADWRELWPGRIESP